MTGTMRWYQEETGLFIPDTDERRNIVICDSSFNRQRKIVINIFMSSRENVGRRRGIEGQGVGGVNGFCEWYMTIRMYHTNTNNTCINHDVCRT